MRYIVRFTITYRNGVQKTKTRMVDAKSDTEAFQIIKNSQLQDYSIEDVNLVICQKM